MIVEEIYNQVAINTGFPLYVNDTTHPDTTRFILEMINQALSNIIDNIYISQNVLEKRDTIVTKPGQDYYAVDGMVKSIQYTQNNDSRLRGKYIPFNYYNSDPGQIPRLEKQHYPITYVIDKGEIRLLPVPDKEYEIKVTSSTTNIVWANDDSSKSSITSVKDAIMASKFFCDLVVLRACAFILARCQNANAQFYDELYKDRLANFIERDSQSLERPHLYNPIKGHYNPRRGLL